MTKEQFISITEWQNRTFGQSTALSKVAHLTKEIVELKNDLENNNPGKRFEFADCIILIFGAAASDGMSYEDICEVVQEKMEINFKRKWGLPNENGVVFHIDEKDN